MTAFSGSCQIRSDGINSGDGRVHFELKALEGKFEWTEFLAIGCSIVKGANHE